MTNSNPQPDQGIVRGFDVLMENGIDFIYDPNPPAVEEDDDEDTDPPYPVWNDVKLDVIGDPPNYDNGQPLLNGYRYSFRYYELEDDTDNPGEFIKTNKQWTLIDQTITRVQPPRNPFITNDGGEIFPIPSPQTGTLIGQGGIRDGSQYGYLQVFDEAELSWLPRCSTFLQEPVNDVLFEMGRHDGSLPYPYYPMDSVNSVVTDEREFVDVIYRVRTTYSVQGENNPNGTPIERTHTINIHQTCEQDPEITEEKMNAILDKCYFTHGFYHDQLYEVDAAPNYSSDGISIGPVIEPEYEVDQEASDLTHFTVYRLVNTVWNSNGLEDIPGMEQDSAKEEDKRDEVRKEQISGLEGTMASTEANYTAEIENIEKNQKEYEEFVKVNEEKKQSLLDNMLVMMNLPADAVPNITPDTLNKFIEEANMKNRQEGN